MKRILAAFVFAVCLFSCFWAGASAENLLSNGGFEQLTSSGKPEGWYPAAYRSQEGYSRIAITDAVSHSGQYSVMVENASSNDARYTCTVRVEPETLYRLSGYVLVEHMQDVGNGANFGIEGIYAFSEGLFDTNGEWQLLEWYGETGEDQTELTFGVRVGGYSAESVGKAYFDDIVLEQVDALPSGVTADIWYDASAGYVPDTSDAYDGPQKQTLLFVALALLFAAAFFILRSQLDQSGGTRLAAALVFLAALLLRIWLGMCVEGYDVDIGCFTAWSLRMAQHGPTGFYAPDYFCDYPPGAMLLLWPVGLLLRMIHPQSGGMELLLVKSLPILCDLLGGLYLYRFAKRKQWPLKGATLLAALYILNPATLVNGSAWGQMDSVLALLLLFTTVCAMRRDWLRALPLFAVSALVKPQALLFAPLGGLWLIRDLSQRKADCKAFWKQVGGGLALALAAALLIVLPFSVHQEADWLIALYAETLSSYAYATLNTANLYYLFGANWTQLSASVPTALPMLAAVVFGAAGAALYLRRKDEHARILPWIFAGMAVLQVALAVLGASYAVYGYVMMAFVYLFVVLSLYRDHQPGALPFAMALALLGIYVLGVKVHERYLFPALPLLLLSYICCRDRRLLWLCVGLSATTFVNTAIVLENSILFGAVEGHLNLDTLFLNRVLCVCNLLLCGYGAWIAVDGLRASAPIAAPEQPQTEVRQQSYRQMLLAPQDHRLHLTLRDYAVMTAVTVVYAVLAFSNLGSTVAPQTGWVSTSADETVVLDLGESKRFSVLYYAGVSYNDFSLSVSEDGENWSKPYPCQMRQGLCYRWQYAVTSTQDGGEVSYAGHSPDNVLWLDGRYLRVNAESAGLNLWEVVARDENGMNIPLTLTAHAGGNEELLNNAQTASHLIDETSTCVGEPSWYNGTYFDEIYHARTAYEHLHGQSPYETTHPPLGKLLMSAAIAMFGMTPFGWRFAGALIGVLMLPTLYLLGMQLTRKRSIAMMAMLAFALDLMHFTQTRIATIDSFPVFFILLSYLFMIRYMQMDHFAVNSGRLMDNAYRKTLWPLLWCGLCMGLSIASKWIGMYSAVGLAVLFFLMQYRLYRVSVTAWDADENDARVQAARQHTLFRILITCGFCVLFFVLIPAVVYYLSYIPYLSPTGPVTLKRVIQAQVGMLDYHSTPGLGMDHPFQSPWWQWPFILKPMWFAQDAFEPAGYGATIMCMGNPWIFYIGAFAMAGVLIACALKYVRLRDHRLCLLPGNGNLTLVTLSIAFFAQYLPWVLVPRSMYIYHYFASVPFIILATAWWLDVLTAKAPRIRKAVLCGYVLGCLVFFAMFFPYASGMLTSIEWLDAMKWFPKLYY